jgi:hypothetical protein
MSNMGSQPIRTVQESAVIGTVLGVVGDIALGGGVEQLSCSGLTRNFDAHLATVLVLSVDKLHVASFVFDELQLADRRRRRAEVAVQRVIAHRHRLTVRGGSGLERTTGDIAIGLSSANLSLSDTRWIGCALDAGYRPPEHRSDDGDRKNHHQILEFHIVFLLLEVGRMASPGLHRDTTALATLTSNTRGNAKLPPYLRKERK